MYSSRFNYFRFFTKQLLLNKKKYTHYGDKVFFWKIGKTPGYENDILAKFNRTIHNSVQAAAKTIEYVGSDVSVIMIAKGVKDYLVLYQFNGMICLSVSAVETVADVTNHILGIYQSLKEWHRTLIMYQYHASLLFILCRTGNVTFSCNDPI